MSLKCGIVGLPNVGKSTLFNALTNSNKAQAENFPFCTIDPNIGIVPLKDERLDKLSEISKSEKKNIRVIFLPNPNQPIENYYNLKKLGQLAKKCKRNTCKKTNINNFSSYNFTVRFIC